MSIFDDEFALVVVANHPENAELKSCEAVSAVILECAELIVAERNYSRIRTRNHTITSKLTKLLSDDMLRSKASVGAIGVEMVIPTRSYDILAGY